MSFGPRQTPFSNSALNSTFSLISLLLCKKKLLKAYRRYLMQILIPCCLAVQVVQIPLKALHYPKPNQICMHIISMVNSSMIKLVSAFLPVFLVPQVFLVFLADHLTPFKQGKINKTIVQTT